MVGYLINIETKSLENEYFREVLFTGTHSQLVVMSLAPGEDIGLETHDDVEKHSADSTTWNNRASRIDNRSGLHGNVRSLRPGRESKATIHAALDGSD